MTRLGGHLGAEVSALVDGQVSGPAEQRAWDHVLTCVRCRGLVERELWLKDRLSGLSGEVPPSSRLEDLYSYSVAAWAEVDRLERSASRRRRAAALGVGSVGAAVLGVAVLVSPPQASTTRHGEEASLTSELAEFVAGGVGVAASVWRHAAQ